MHPSEWLTGNIVFAARDLVNDGTHPEFGESAVVAAVGTRGVIVKTGHTEDNPDNQLFLVRFEGADGTLGPPIGCWPSELEADEEKVGDDG